MIGIDQIQIAGLIKKKIEWKKGKECEKEIETEIEKWNQSQDSKWFRSLRPKR